MTRHKTTASLSPSSLVSMVAALSIFSLSIFLLRDTAFGDTASLGPAGTLTHTVSGTTETWRIDAPNVTQPLTPYPQVRFQPGDHVTVTAGGGVRTGGDGAKREGDVGPQDTAINALTQEGELCYR